MVGLAYGLNKSLHSDQSLRHKQAIWTGGWWVSVRFGIQSRFVEVDIRSDSIN